MAEPIEWSTLSQAYAFLGNSLLSPMTQTSDAGIDPAFWEAFPDFGSERAALACKDAAACVRALSARGEREGRDPVELASTEFTRLFIGPPSPAAAPWESFYRSESENPVGFGAATFEMRDLLRAAGLEVNNENNQYEDHIGLELLFLSELCRRRAESAEGKAHDDLCGDSAILAFVRDHPLGWIGTLRESASETVSGGYIASVLGVAEALLAYLAERLEA